MDLVRLKKEIKEILELYKWSGWNDDDISQCALDIVNLVEGKESQGKNP